MNEIEESIAFFESWVNILEADGYCPEKDKFELAISALREKQEREKGCEYCTTEEQRNDSGRIFYKEFLHDTSADTTLDDAHLQIAYDTKHGWVLHFEDDYWDRMFDVAITSCPHCSRKLEVDK